MIDITNYASCSVNSSNCPRNIHCSTNQEAKTCRHKFLFTRRWRIQKMDRLMPANFSHYKSNKRTVRSVQRINWKCDKRVGLVPTCGHHRRDFITPISSFIWPKQLDRNVALIRGFANDAFSASPKLLANTDCLAARSSNSGGEGHH